MGPRCRPYAVVHNYAQGLHAMRFPRTRVRAPICMHTCPPLQDIIYLRNTSIESIGAAIEMGE